MSNLIVEKLLESFDKLEECIETTVSAIHDKGEADHTVTQRIEQYRDIVSKQRQLAYALREHLQSHNLEEVTRHVRLINGLSSMIREDAHEILTSRVGAVEGVKTDITVC